MMGEMSESHRKELFIQEWEEFLALSAIYHSSSFSITFFQKTWHVSGIQR